jgi:hypothetical protein
MRLNQAQSSHPKANGPPAMVGFLHLRGIVFEKEQT